MKKPYAALVGSVMVMAGCTQSAPPPAVHEVQGVIKYVPAPAPLPSAKVVKTSSRVKLSARDFDCMARNVYHEAGVENNSGKIAVAQVTLNRVKSKKWGNDVCSVVYSKSQFSWTLQKKKRHVQPKGELWDASIKAVREFEEGKRVAQLMDSLFYHTDYIKRPRWADANQAVAKVGQHIFYTGAKKS